MPHLCKRRDKNPYWKRKTSTLNAREKVINKRMEKREKKKHRRQLQLLKIG